MKTVAIKNKSFSKYTIRLLFTILVIIYILYAAFLLTYYYSAAKEEDHTNKMTILSHQISYSDQSVISFAVLLDALSHNSLMKNIVYVPDRASILQSLQEFNARSTFINKTALYIHKTGRVYSSSARNLSKTDWERIISERDSSGQFTLNYSFSDFSVEYIDGELYFFCDFLQSFYEPMATLAVQCNKEVFFESLMNEQVQSDEPVYIFTEAGDLVFSSNGSYVDESEFIENSDPNLLIGKSSITKWTFYKQSSPSVLGGFLTLLLSVLPVLTFFFILIILAATIGSRLLAKPVKSFIEEYSDQIAKLESKDALVPDDLNSIKAIYDEMHRQNQLNQSLLTRVSSHVSESIVRDLISSEMTEQTELNKTLKTFDCGLLLDNPCIVVAIATYAEEKGHHIDLRVVSDRIRENIIDPGIVSVAIPYREYVVLVLQDRNLDEDLNLLALNISSRLNKIVIDGHHLTCAVGSSVDDLMQLRSSYLRATSNLYQNLYSLENKDYTGEVSIHELQNDITELFDVLIKDIDMPYFQIHEEIVSEICDKLNNSVLSIEDAKRILYGFTVMSSACMQRLAVNEDEKAEYHRYANMRIDGTNDNDDIKGAFKDICSELERLVRPHCEKRSNQYIVKTLQIIHDSYENPDLNCQMIATNLGISRSYLSTLFNSCVETSFTNYINMYRIEKASALLKKQSMSVNEAAEAVGYLNSQVFIRSFKKYYGVTPGQWMKNL